MCAAVEWFMMLFNINDTERITFMLFPGKPAGAVASKDQLYVVTTTMTIRKNRRICNDSTMAFFALLQIKVRNITTHGIN